MPLQVYLDEEGYLLTELNEVIYLPDLVFGVLGDALATR